MKCYGHLDTGLGISAKLNLILLRIQIYEEIITLD